MKTCIYKDGDKCKVRINIRCPYRIAYTKDIARCNLNRKKGKNE